MFETSKVIEIGEGEFTVECASILVVRLHGKAPNKREVYIEVYLNGTLVANGSAADNFAANVISTNFDTVTVPIPNGSTVRIKKTGPGIAEARLFRV